MLLDMLNVFLISMVPVIECRGAIPIGCVLELPFYLNAGAAILGNLLPVPFILFLMPKVLDFLSRFRLFRPIVSWLRSHAAKKSGRILNGAFTGLLFFVMIPCPGTGAWTGTLVASLFDMPKGRAILAVSLGVLGCAVIMTLACYGVLGFLSFLA